MGQQLPVGTVTAIAAAEPSRKRTRDSVCSEFVVSETRNAPMISDATWQALAPYPNMEGELDHSQRSVQQQKVAEELRLIERVALALRATGYGALRNVVVSVGNQHVILNGRVPTYFMKQVAQTAALKVPGVYGICNDLHVPHWSTDNKKRHQNACVVTG